MLHGLFYKCRKQGLCSSCNVKASYCDCFSCWGAQVLGSWTQWLRHMGLSCSVASGIFPGQGSNPCLLHWQADSLSLSHQGISDLSFMHTCICILEWFSEYLRIISQFIIKISHVKKHLKIIKLTISFGTVLVII